MRESDLIIILYWIDLIIKHLLVSILPKKQAESHCRSQTHIRQQTHRKTRAEHRWFSVEVGDSYSVEDVLEDEGAESYEIEYWYTVSKEQRYQDGHLRDCYSPVEVVLGATMLVQPRQIVVLFVVAIAVDVGFGVPAIGNEHHELTDVVDDRLEAEDAHGYRDLCADSLIPACLKVSKLSLERVPQQIPVLNLLKIHSDHNREDSDIQNVANDDHVAVDVLFDRVASVPNEGNEGPSDEIKRVVDEEEGASQNHVVELLVLAEQEVLPAYFATLGLLALGYGCTIFSTFHEAEILSILSIFFHNGKEAILVILLFAKAAQSCIHVVFILQMIVVLPSCECLLLELNILNAFISKGVLEVLPDEVAIYLLETTQGETVFNQESLIVIGNVH